MCLGRIGTVLGWLGAIAPRGVRLVFATTAAVVLIGGVGIARTHAPADGIDRGDKARVQLAMVLPKVTPEFADRETIIWLAQASGTASPDRLGLAFDGRRWYHPSLPSASSLCPLPCLRIGSAPRTSTRG